MRPAAGAAKPRPGGPPAFEVPFRVNGKARRYQTWKDSPQPQRPFSFGLTKVKPADIAFTS